MVDYTKGKAKTEATTIVTPKVKAKPRTSSNEESFEAPIKRKIRW
jgi:hypothetical protein